MTTVQLYTTGYIVLLSEPGIEAITYRSYLREYGREKTASATGSPPRMRTRKNKTEQGTQYQIWSWDANGNNPYYAGVSFGTKAAAELYIFEKIENYIQNEIQNKNWNAPTFFNDYEEAVKEMANLLDRSESVINRYLELQAITECKNKALRKEAESRKAESKLEMNNAIKAEAEILAPLVDAIFKNDVKEAQQLSGDEKTRACGAAMLNFLNRIDYGKIKSNFWEVFRAIK